MAKNLKYINSKYAIQIEAKIRRHHVVFSNFCFIIFFINTMSFSYIQQKKKKKKEENVFLTQFTYFVTFINNTCF